MNKSIKLLALVGLIAVLMLTACSKTEQPGEGEIPLTSTAWGSQAGSDATVQPTQQEQGGVDPAPQGGYGSTYPFPGQGGAANPYPAPPGTDSTAPGAYPPPQSAYPTPGNGTSNNPYPLPVTSTPGNAYPPPGSATDTNPYPPPQTTQTAAPTAVDVTPSVTPTPLPTPTPFPTPIPLSARMIATDPDEVVLVSGQLQLIEFFAFWDGYSKSMAPIVHELEARYGDEINFVYLDIDDPAAEELKTELEYEIQPHFFLIDRDGNIIQEWLGLVKSVEFEKVFSEVLE